MRPMAFVQRENYKAPKRGRRAAVLLIDFFTTVIMTFAFFAGIFRIVYDKLPSTETIRTEASERGERLLEITGETRMQHVEEGKLVDLSVTIEEDILLLAKTSYFVLGMDYTVQDKDGHLSVETITEDETLLSTEKDDFYHYCFQFRPKMDIFVEGEDSYSYINQEFLELDSTNKELVSSDFDMNSVFVLSQENAQRLHDYLELEDNGEEPTEIYEKVYSLYDQARSKAISEVVNDYDPYQQNSSEMQGFYVSYVRGYDLFLLLSYLCGYLFTYVFFPACFRNGRTLSYRLFGLAMADSSPRKIPIYKHIIRNVIAFVTNLWAMFFSPLFLANLYILSSPFLGPIALFQLVFFSFLLYVLSFILALSRSDGQTLEEFSTMTYTVDLSRPEQESVFDNQGVRQ